MLKMILGFGRDVFLLVHETHQLKASVKTLEHQVDHLSRAVEALAYQVEHIKEVDRLEREKMALQLENALLQFERRLPPS